MSCLIVRQHNQWKRYDWYQQEPEPMLGIT
jgi:hypothetical protein